MVTEELHLRQQYLLPVLTQLTTPLVVRLTSLQRMPLLDVLLPGITVGKGDGDTNGMTQFTDTFTLRHHLPPLQSSW